jgi:hypothetical protein
MFTINDDLSIHITRGDVGVIEVSADMNENELYKFKPGDIVRLRVYPKKNHADVVLQKDVVVESETETVDINLEINDTKLGEIINKPTVYWYEVELNPDTIPQTIIGYDTNGPKLFTLYPEGGELV